MNKFMQFAVAAFAFLVSGIAFAFPMDYNAYGPSEEHMRQARAQASREGKLILVSFKLGSRCSPCKYVEGEFDSSDTRKVFKGKYVFVDAWANTDDGKSLAETYGVKGAPHFVVLAPDGTPRCLAYRSFENPMQAHALGTGLAQVKSWPVWPKPMAMSTSPKCLDAIKQVSLQ